MWLKDSVWEASQNNLLHFITGMVMKPVRLRANGLKNYQTMLRPFAQGCKFDRFQTLRNNIQQHATGCANGRNI